MKKSTRKLAIHAFSLAVSLTIASPWLHAARLVAYDDPEVFPGVGNFGSAVSLSTGISLVGAHGFDTRTTRDQGAAYVFRNFGDVTGTLKENVQLTASDAVSDDRLGAAVSLSGHVALLGGDRFLQAAYVFRGLDSATGTINESLKLIASDGEKGDYLFDVGDYFASSVSLSGRIGLVGAELDDIGANPQQGSAYIYRSLDTATGTISETAKLTARDGAAYSGFGSAVSLSGSIGLVGALTDGIGRTGSAYVFRNLDTAVGAVNEAVKLTASDGAHLDFFGQAVSISGSIGLVGAHSAQVGANRSQGAVYLFRDLDTATGAIHENVKVIASDGRGGDGFGCSVSVSGDTGIVGAFASAYLFLGFETAEGIVKQNVKLVASHQRGYPHDAAVGLDGDQFVFSSPNDDYGMGIATTGSVGSVTTLDTSNTTKVISDFSFESQDDWIIGDTTDANQVIFQGGNIAKVRVPEKGVYVGRTATSDSNALVLEGKLSTTLLTIGSTEGNSGNTVTVRQGGALRALRIRLAPGNSLRLEGNYPGIVPVLWRLATSRLKAWSGTNWGAVTPENYHRFITISFEDGYTIVKGKVGTDL